MKQLLSPLTITMLSVMVLLLTVKKESANESAQSRNEIRPQQPVYKESHYAALDAHQDSLSADMTLMMLPLKDGMPAGKSMNLLIY